MDYDIKFVEQKNSLSVFSIDGVEYCNIKVKTIKELEDELNKTEHLLLNNLKFDSYEDLLSGIKAIEYFSNKNPNLVKDYINRIRLKLESFYSDKNRVNRKNCLKIMASYELDNFEKDGSFNRIANLDSVPETQQILLNSFELNTSISPIDKRQIKNKNYYAEFVGEKFGTAIGDLTYLGIENHMHIWMIGDQKQEIFAGLKISSSTSSMANIIITVINNIHEIITNNMIDKLIDFKKVDELRILQLYSKVCTDAFIAYLKFRLRLITEQRIRVGITSNAWGKSNLALLLSKNDTISINRVNQALRSPYINILTQLFKETLVYESKAQVDYLLNSNHVDISLDYWKFFCMCNKRLREFSFDFSSIKQSVIKREFKLYYKHLVEHDLISKNTIRSDKGMAKNVEQFFTVKKIIAYLTNKYKVQQTADITVSILNDVLEKVYMTRLDGEFKSQQKNTNNSALVEKVYYQIRTFISWVIDNAEEIKTKKPSTTLLYSIEINGSNTKATTNKTEIIPEKVIEEIINKLDNLTPGIYRRLLLILLNNPRRYNEIQKLDRGCIMPYTVNGEQQYDEGGYPQFILTFVEHKKHKNTTIEENGLDYSNYTRDMIVNYIVAREIVEQEKEVKQLEDEINSNRPSDRIIKIQKLFVVKDESTKEGYRYITPKMFSQRINTFIRVNDIRNTDGTLWYFHPRQTRKTSSYISVAHGASLEELQELLFHTNKNTTQKSYTEISEILLADTNSEYLRKEFDERLFTNKEDKKKFSAEELKLLFKQFCFESRKVYYNRKMLGICTSNYEQECPHKIRDSLTTDDFPCSTCADLATSKSCKEGWDRLKKTQEENLKLFKQFIADNKFKENDLDKLPQYRATKTRYLKTLKVISAIDAY
ncbi:hypothetical protein [Natranaerobius trueperi]|uniref:Tyr recombinase domain-containing protein n=1 Tax=Natranaerobius trueperi TaxID=759412 RepID=A0A226C1J4_9FIRM|nr:hypothetical protein [Natranaerobius trueperi]OWZ84287.1 hypothetical protein CDO51_04305 [Natranaerobius trueperi]